MYAATSQGEQTMIDLGSLTVPVHCPEVSLANFTDDELLAEVRRRLAFRQVEEWLDAGD